MGEEENKKRNLLTEKRKITKGIRKNRMLVNRSGEGGWRMVTEANEEEAVNVFRQRQGKKGRKEG